MIETVTWILTGLGVVGAVLNSLQRRACFAWWIVANIGWICVNAYRGLHAETVLFSVYLALAVLGLINWRRARRPSAGLELPKVRP